MLVEEAPEIIQLSEVHEPAEILDGLAVKKLIYGGGTGGGEEDSMGKGESEGPESPGSVRVGAPAGGVYWCDDGRSAGGSPASSGEPVDAATVIVTVFSAVPLVLVAVIV
jgi:hypothetical protein